MKIVRLICSVILLTQASMQMHASSREELERMRSDMGPRSGVATDAPTGYVVKAEKKAAEKAKAKAPAKMRISGRKYGEYKGELQRLFKNIDKYKGDEGKKDLAKLKKEFGPKFESMRTYNPKEAESLANTFYDLVEPIITGKKTAADADEFGEREAEKLEPQPLETSFMERFIDRVPTYINEQLKRTDLDEATKKSEYEDDLENLKISRDHRTKIGDTEYLKKLGAYADALRTAHESIMDGLQARERRRAATGSGTTGAGAGAGADDPSYAGGGGGGGGSAAAAPYVVPATEPAASASTGAPAASVSGAAASTATASSTRQPSLTAASPTRPPTGGATGRLMLSQQRSAASASAALPQGLQAFNESVAGIIAGINNLKKAAEGANISLEQAPTSLLNALETIRKANAFPAANVFNQIEPHLRALFFILNETWKKINARTPTSTIRRDYFISNILEPAQNIIENLHTERLISDLFYNEVQFDELDPKHAGGGGGGGGGSAAAGTGVARASVVGGTTTTTTDSTEFAQARDLLDAISKKIDAALNSQDPLEALQQGSITSELNALNTLEGRISRADAIKVLALMDAIENSLMGNLDMALTRPVGLEFQKSVASRNQNLLRNLEPLIKRYAVDWAIAYSNYNNKSGNVKRDDAVGILNRAQRASVFATRAKTEASTVQRQVQAQTPSKHKLTARDRRLRKRVA